MALIHEAGAAALGASVYEAALRSEPLREVLRLIGEMTSIGLNGRVEFVLDLSPQDNQKLLAVLVAFDMAEARLQGKV